MNPTSMASSGGYGPMPHGYVPPVSGSYPPALSATGSSPASSVEPYDYSSAIDPALESAGPAHMAVPPHAYDGAQGYRADLKPRGLERASPYATATAAVAADAPNARGGASPSLPARPPPGLRSSWS